MEQDAFFNFAGSLSSRIYKHADHFFQGNKICFTGAGPFINSDLMSLLPDHVNAHDLGEHPLEDDDDDHTDYSDIRFFILGQSEYDEDEIKAYVRYAEDRAAFLPQEGFLDLILFGYDWWHGETIEDEDSEDLIEELNAVLEYHAGLQYVKSLEDDLDWEWPSTYAEPSNGNGTDEGEYIEVTDTRKAGYEHWSRGKRLSDRRRRARLRPIVNQYVLQLGRVLPLQEIAETIAGLCKRLKRQDRFPTAIKNYENDLAWLKKNYYDRIRGKKPFRWPTTDI
jgi:hypothetical protein